MSLEKYFRDEMDYLRLLGKEVASARPHLTSFLSEQGSDPDVERLLEGFAFLSGNLRAKIEDNFPELTHGLLNMLWPNYLRPTPSMTVIEYSPDQAAMTEAALVPKGTQLLSRAILLPENESDTAKYSTSSDDEEEIPQCQFRTCRDTWLFPFSIRDASVHSSNEQGVINLTFASSSEMTLNKLNLNKLRFYLGDDAYTSHQLYLWLNHYFERAEIRIGDSTISLADLEFRPVGFERDEALLPYSKNAYPGYRILQEYFCFPESFLFLDAVGFPDFPEELKTNDFTLSLYFDHPLPPDIKMRPTTFRLHCTPAVNLFTHESEAIELNGTQTEYPLKASYTYPNYYEIFSVDKVESWVGKRGDVKGRKRGAVRNYVPFESFQHQIEHAHGRTALYYRLRANASPFDSCFEYNIAFVRGDETEVAHYAENVAIQLTCTNRELPLNLRVGDIDQPTKGSPSFATFRNITRPSMPLHPLIDGSLHWSLISNMSLNYMSLLSKEALQQILRTYDLPSLHNRQAARVSQKRMEGIEKIETKPVDRLFMGVPVRGLESTLYLKQRGAFSSEGELYLFSTILARFFSLYASVNAFHLLKVINTDNQECYQWPIQVGQHALM